MLLTIFFWIVTHLPASFWLLLIFIGAGIAITAGTLGRLPRARTYAPLVKPLGLLIASLGIFMYGGYTINQHYIKLINEYKEKVRAAEEASREVNTVIQTEIVVQREVVRERHVEYRDRIIEIADVIDEKCELAPEVIDLHNRAATNPIPDPEPAKRKKR